MSLLIRTTAGAMLKAKTIIVFNVLPHHRKGKRKMVISVDISRNADDEWFLSTINSLFDARIYQIKEGSNGFAKIAKKLAAISCNIYVVDKSYIAEDIAGALVAHELSSGNDGFTYNTESFIT